MNTYEGGLSSTNQEVSDRVAAYMGKPQQLAQKYAQQMQLIDLLALQKIKSMQEAAQRDLALKQGQQGMPPPIKDQREQQVFENTQRELLGNMRQSSPNPAGAGPAAPGPAAPGPVAAPTAKRPPMMAGLPAAPGAAQAAQPKAMAAGGIVAFSGDKPVGSVVPDPDPYKQVNEEGEVTTPELEWIRKKWRVAKEAAKEAAKNLTGSAREAAETYQEPGMGAAMPSVQKLPRISPTPRPVENKPAPITPEDMKALDPMYRQGLGALPQAQPQPRPQPRSAAPAAAPAAPAAAAPTTPAAPTIAPPPASDFQQKLEKGILTQLEADPAAKRREEMEFAQKFWEPHLKSQQDLYARQAKEIEANRAPERSKEEKIYDALMAMGQYRNLGFGAAAAARADKEAATAEWEQRQKAMERLHALQQKGVDASAAIQGKAWESGAKAMDAARTAYNDALKSGMSHSDAMATAKMHYDVANLQAQSAKDTAELRAKTDLQIAAINERSNARTAEASRLNMNAMERMKRAEINSQEMERGIRAIDERVRKEVDSIYKTLMGKPPNEAQQRQIDAVTAKGQMDIADLQRRTEARNKQLGFGVTELDPATEAALKKYRDASKK